jgi:hypothetical protein
MHEDNLEDIWRDYVTRQKHTKAWLLTNDDGEKWK